MSSVKVENKLLKIRHFQLLHIINLKHHLPSWVSGAGWFRHYLISLWNSVKERLYNPAHLTVLQINSGEKEPTDHIFISLVPSWIVTMKAWICEWTYESVCQSGNNYTVYSNSNYNLHCCIYKHTVLLSPVPCIKVAEKINNYNICIFPLHQ